MGVQEDEETLRQAEKNKMLNDYYMRAKPYPSSECIQPNLENDPIVRNHIIVCGIHSSIAHFIMPLRARYLHPY